MNNPEPTQAVTRSKEDVVFEARGLTKVYDMGEVQVHALRGIDLDLFRTELVVMLGPSGSGKSTLIRHFNRLIEPTAGRILVDGEDILHLDEPALRHFRRRKIAMVFQRFGLLPHRNVLDNAMYGLRIDGGGQSLMKGL